MRKPFFLFFMTHLHMYDELFTTGLRYDLLTLLSLGSVFCGLFVIITKNPIVSVLFLIGLFLNIAVYLMMLGMHFIGLSYLLVYVGAVSILFLFILMLINVRISELVTDNNNSIPLAIMIGIFFSFTLYNLFPSQFKANLYSFSLSQMPYDLSTNHFNNTYVVSGIKEISLTNNELLLVTTNNWDGALAEFSHITSIGNILYTVYPIWLIITSLILLLAMVGSIVITIKQ